MTDHGGGLNVERLGAAWLNMWGGSSESPPSDDALVALHGLMAALAREYEALAAAPVDRDGLREALAGGNYLQVYDHRQSRWLSADEAVAAIAALPAPEPKDRPSEHVHEWTDAPDDEQAWYCPGCGKVEYPGDGEVEIAFGMEPR